MYRGILLLFLLVTTLPIVASAIDVSTVYPEAAVIGEPVTVIGGPFESNIQVVLGNTRIEPRFLSERQLVFLVPGMEPGVYALSLVGEDGYSEQVFKLEIRLKPPEIESLSPEIVDECYDMSQHQVSLRGQNLYPGAEVLLDNLVIPSEWESDTLLSFEAPRLRAGMYGVQVINPDGSASLPHSFEFSNTPEIRDVTIGDDFVNYYQLVIRGKNFFYRSILVVSEYPAGLSDLPPSQHSLVAQNPPRQAGFPSSIQQESLYYQDCNTLIYNRYPLSGESRRVVLRVSNPDGKQTQQFEVSVP